MNKSDPIILLVEDEPTLQFVLERQLQNLGYEIALIVDNGLTAVKKVREQQFDLVFMDVRLPGIDGITATNRIRAFERQVNRHTKIVGLTAFAERQRCLESGMDDFLQKPVLLEQLAAILKKHCNSNSDALVQEPQLIAVSQFQKTANELSAIQERITNLRKRVGLDTNVG